MGKPTALVLVLLVLMALFVGCCCCSSALAPRRESIRVTRVSTVEVVRTVRPTRTPRPTPTPRPTFTPPPTATPVPVPLATATPVVATPQPRTITLGEAVEGMLDNPQAADVWTLTLEEETMLDISLTAVDDGWDPVLNVWRTGGEWLASDDDGGPGTNSRLRMLTLEAGTYEIWVQAYDRSGAYTLSAEVAEVPEERTIAYGEAVTGELTESEPETWWTFSGQSGEIVSIAMTGQEGFRDTYLELYDADGNLLVSDDDSGVEYSARIEGFVLPGTGEYRIVATGFNDEIGGYELTLSRAKEATINYGQTLEGELTGTGHRDVWHFDGAAGDLISLSMVGLGDFQDTYLELYDQDGQFLTADDNGGKADFARIEAFALPLTGTYRVVAGAFPVEELCGSAPPAEMAGPYRLTLRQLEVRTIGYGQTLAADLTEEAMAGLWEFSGQAGEVIRIEMTGAGDLEDPYLELYGPDGALLTQDDDSGDGYAALIDNVILPSTGTYRIVARTFADEVGRYRLALRRVVVGDQPIAFGETVTSTLTLETPREFWRFQGEAGAVVQVAMVGLADFQDPVLELYGPDGTQLVQDDDGGPVRSALIDGVDLPEDGVYRLVARGFRGQLGEYRLTLERNQ